MKLKILIYLFTLQFCYSFEQSLDSNLTLNKKALLILPSQIDDKKYNNIADKVLSIISTQASSIGRFDIIDRNIIDEILEEQKFQLSGYVTENDIIKIGEFAAAEEALILEIVHFGQKGIPLKKEDQSERDKKKEDQDETLFSWVIKTAVTNALEKSSKKDTLQIGLEIRNNIHTELRANIKFVNIEDGKVSNSIPLSSSYTGGNKDASLIKVLDNITLQIRWKLKDLYMINSELIEVNKNYITMFSGNNLGLKKGAIFEITSKDQLKTYKGKTVTLPGKSRGLIKIIDVGPDASRGKIIRKWKDIQPGHKAYELKKAPILTSINLSFLKDKKYELYGNFIFNTFGDFSASLNGYLGSVIDSRDQMNGYLGFGTDLDYPVFSIFGTSTSLSLRIPALFAFSSDDKGHNIASFFSDPSINLNFAIQITPNRDIIFSTRYKLTHLHGPWQWQRETGLLNDEGKSITKTEPAVWELEEPLLETPDIYFSIAIRKIRF